MVDQLEIVDRQSVEWNALLLGQLDDVAGDLVCIAERDIGLPHQPVGHVRRGRKPHRGRLPHPLAVDREVLHHAGHRREAQRQRVERVERHFLVFLHVLGISERQPLHHHHERGQRANDAADLGAHQLGRVGIALLRHDRRAGGELVGKPNEVELCRAPDHQLLGKPAEVHRHDRARRQRLEDEVAIGDRIERVRRRPVEAQRLGRHVAIDRIGRARQRRRPERALVEPPARVAQPAAVASQHLHIGQQMMAERHRLRALQMGEARHDRFGLGIGPFDQRQLQHLDLRQQRIDRIAHIESEIRRHLVVARARRMQASGRIADQLAQPRFHVHVDVFEGARKVELLRVDLGQHGV